jgi:hypothetical protein
MTTPHDANPYPTNVSRGEASNGLGLAGFIVSLVGLISCGLISPIGLVLSLVGLGKSPKGFAIAGTVLGILGSLWVFVLVFVVGMGTMLAAIGIRQVQGPTRMVPVMMAVGQYTERYHTVPKSLDALGVQPSMLTDAWGTQYRLTPSADGRWVELRSAGADRAFDTPDDMVEKTGVDDDAPEPTKP